MKTLSYHQARLFVKNNNIPLNDFYEMDRAIEEHPQVANEEIHFRYDFRRRIFQDNKKSA